MWLAVVILGAIGAVIFMTVRNSMVATSVIDAEEAADESADLQ